MNQDISAGQWKQMRGTLKSWWGKLSDDDFDWIGGEKDKLIGLIQEKYGQSWDQAQQEVERRMKEYGEKMPDAGAAVAGIAAKAQELGAKARSKASELAETASSYLQEKNVRNMAEDVSGLVRRYPVQSLLIGIGLGFLLARSRRD